MPSASSELARARSSAVSAKQSTVVSNKCIGPIRRDDKLPPLAADCCFHVRNASKSEVHELNISARDQSTWKDTSKRVVETNGCWSNG